MIKEAYEQGFLEACDEYGLDEDDMEVMANYEESLQKTAGIGFMYKKYKNVMSGRNVTGAIDSANEATVRQTEK